MPRDESVPEVFDRLVELSARMVDANPAPPSWELASEREMTGTDAEERVIVSIADYKVASLRIDHQWFPNATLEEVEAHVRDAVNATLAAYLDAEFTEAADTHYGIQGVHDGLRQLSADLNAAFGRHIDQATDKLR